MKVVRRWLAVLLAVVMSLGCGVTVSAASTRFNVQMDVTYRQSEAREMLGLVNDFRTGDEAWYWSGPSSTNKETPELDAYVYDYTLEAIAMQRAAEIAAKFSHTRPNGTNCGTALSEFGFNSWTKYGENIAAGYLTAEAAFESWKETDKDYFGQGHRRNMLDSRFNRIGIGHVVYNGRHFWVQEFAASNNGNTTVTEPNDQETTVNLRVSTSEIRSLELRTVDSITMQIGESVQAPQVEVTLRLKENWGGANTVTLIPEWKIDDEGIAIVDNGQLLAKAVGSTSIAAEVNGETVTVPVTVTGLSLTGASVALPQESWNYNGKPIEPVPTVTLNGTLLSEGTDYTVSYQNNIQEGTATVIITGMGRYSGTASAAFSIIPCDHRWDNGTVTISAGCETDGVMTYTCTLCGVTYTDPIPSTGHTWSEGVVETEASCETAGEKVYTCGACGAQYTEEIPPLDHSWDEGTITQFPSCTEPGIKTITCTRCGRSYTESVDALDHSFGEWETVVSPTCTNQGSEKRVCERCGYTETQALDANGHVWESDYTIDQQPTCTQDGSKSIHCSTCDAVMDTQVIWAVGHDWDEGTETAAPGCETAGTKTFTCKRCGDQKNEIIAASGHSYGDWEETKSATCTEEGEKTRTCSRCGNTETESIACVPHTWDEGTITTVPTCAAEGVRSFTCTVCGETYTEAVEKVPHTPVTDAAVAPTCEESGLTEGSHCSVCGAVITAQEIIPAAGHSWDEGNVTTEPTCTADGAAVYTCMVCGETRIENVEALGHSFGEWVTVSSPTCTDQGNEKRICKRCGYTEMRNLDVAEHTWESEYTTDKEPSCNTDGSKSIHCTRCDAVKDIQVIPALGHSWDAGEVTKEATCMENGERTYTCSRCGESYHEMIPLSTHTIQWVVDKAATETEEGSRHEECSVCGWIGKKEVIPVLSAATPSVTPDLSQKTPDDENTAGLPDNNGGNSGNNDNQTGTPNTGDQTSLFAVVAAMIFATGAMSVALVKRKKHI